MENDALDKLRQAAEVANGNAQQIIEAYREKPVFCSNSLCPAIARAQQRANAGKRILREYRAIQHITAAIEERDTDAMDQIRQVSAMKAPPIFVGDLSFPTAHEAALVLGDTILTLWQEAGGEDAAELAPDRRHAEYDGDNADIAIEVCLEIWQRLQELQGKLPGDLWGQIQQEYTAATHPTIADSADKQNIFTGDIPEDSNVVALAVAIHEEQKKPQKERRSNKQIAREYVGKTGLNPDSLLRQVRRYTQ